jgi:hypothetical protein
MRAPPILLLLCTLGAMSRAALAGDLPVQSAETTAMTDKSRQLFQEGVAAYNKGKLLEAQASFLAAWSLHPHWQIAGNLADIETELHKYREAAEHATYYAKHAPADRHEKAEAMVKRAVAKVGTLAIEVDAPGADVLIDGTLAGRAPLAEAVFLDPGEHTVTVRFPGRPDAMRAVTLVAGGSQAVSIKVLPREPPPVPRIVERRPLWPALAAGGAAVIGLAVGAGLTVAANGKSGDAASLRAKVGPAGCAIPGAVNAAGCSAVASDLQSQTSLARGAAGALVSGGALAVATASLAAWALVAPTAKVRVTPVVGANDAGVVVMGAW